MKIFSFSLAPMVTSCSSSDIEPIKEQGNSSNGINLVSEENSSFLLLSQRSLTQL